MNVNRAYFPNRRQILGGSLGGFFAWAAASGWNPLRATPTARPMRKCLVLWMAGGPSQFETFDPKTGVETAGPQKPIGTNVPGLQIGEHLPQLSHLMHHACVMRHITSEEGEHLRASYLMHTGFRLTPGFPRPGIGAVVAHSRRQDDLPGYVSLGSRGFGPAYLGSEYGPFSVESHEEAVELLQTLGRRRSRMELLGALDAGYAKQHPFDSLTRRASMMQQVDQLLDTKFAGALDIRQEDDRVRNAYGNDDFGARCLVARRLLEIGVPFVEVQLDGWDTHVDNFRETERLCRQLDRSWAELLRDAGASGLLDETLIVWMGEFGRTPVINAQQGRDHFPRVTPVVLAGGGAAGGNVLGATSSTGQAIVGDAHSAGDLFATIFSILGIDAEQEFTTDFGSPTTATDQGRIIAGAST